MTPQKYMSAYHSDELLNELANRPIKGNADCEKLIEDVVELWAYSDWGIKKEGREWSISTAGWSGNEDLICALQDNSLFWLLCWQQSRRGGHYVFQTHEIKE